MGGVEGKEGSFGVGTWLGTWLEIRAEVWGILLARCWWDVGWEVELKVDFEMGEMCSLFTDHLLSTNSCHPSIESFKDFYSGSGSLKDGISGWSVESFLESLEIDEIVKIDKE
jgi:hypothetical protein